MTPAKRRVKSDLASRLLRTATAYDRLAAKAWRAGQDGTGFSRHAARLRARAHQVRDSAERRRTP